MRKVSGKKYFRGIHNYEQTTGQLYGSELNRSNPVSSNDKTLSLFEDYSSDANLGDYLLPGEEKDTPGFFDKIWDYATSALGKQAHKLWTGVTNPMSIHNSFWERQTESSLTSSENELAKINLNIKDLDDVQDYINDVNNYKSLVQRQNQGEDVKAELNQLGAKIKERQEFYKTEGKKSDTLVDLFFNPDKSSLGTEETLTNIMGLTSKEQKALDDSSWYDITAGAAALSSRIDKLLSSAGEGINKILPEFVTGNTRGEFTRRYIAGTDANDRSTDRFFNDHTSGNDINKLQQKVNNYREMYDRDRKEADLEVKKQLNYLQNGAWYFNPKNINPEYRRLLNEGDYGFFGFALPGNLPYSFAELGSSWGDITHMAGSLAVDAAIAQGTKFAIKKLNPYAAAATTTIDALAAVKNAQRGERIAENVNFLGGALATTSSIYFTKEMRRWETNSEAMDAYSNRVLNQAMNKGLDIDGILNRSNQYLNSIGIDTDGLDRIKQTQLALAYNSPTGDAEFEDLKHDARQGLSYLINANNALAFMDYIEALPFMNYTKSFLKDFGSKGFRRVKYTPNELRRMGEKQWITEDRALREAIDPTIRGEFDRQIDRVAKKWISNPKTQLKFSRGSKFLTKKASELFPLMTKEGIEEGQQYLLQERYQRGEYDNEEQQESMFALPSVLNTAELAADAIAGYLGINFGDPNNGDDELRRAMEIGAMTAMWFRAPHMATNLMSNEMNERLNKYTLGLFGDTEHENVRNLIQQFKNDNVIGKVVAENYGRNQDDEHVGIFFDAFSKRGVNRDRLAESLEDFKRFKGPGVTDDYIDKDIKLLNTAWNVYNNPLTDSTLKDLNVKKDSSNHKQFVKLATRAIIDADDAGKILKEDAQKFQEQKNAFVNEALGILNDLDFYNTIQDADKVLGTHTYTESPNGKLAAIIRKISDTYDEVQKYNAKAYNEYTSSEKAKQDAIKALESQGVEKDVDVDGSKSYSDDVIADKIKEIADERFNQTREDFVREHIEDVFNYNYLKQARKLHSLFTNREKLLEYVQQELGTDINIERLSGMIHELNNSIRDYSNSVKSRTAKLNAIRKGLGLEETDEEQAINEFGIELPEETVNQMGVLLVNNALYQTLNTAAEAYMLGKANPNNLRRTQRKPSWNQLTDEQKEYYINLYQSQKEEGEVTEKQAMAQYNKERREYKNKLHELQREYNQIISKNKGEKDIDAESENRLDEIKEEAAKLYIESELQTRIDRNTIAHKEAIEERPVLYDDISAAADGNEVAAKKVKQEVEKQAEEEKKAEEEQTLSPEEGEAAVDEQPEEEGQVNDADESGTLDDNNTEEGTINEVHDRLDEGTIHPHISDAEKYLRDLYTFEDPDEAPRGKKQKTEEGTLNIDEQDSSDVANTFDEEGTLSNLDEESADLDRADRDFDGSVDGENIPNKPETVTDHKEVSFNYIDQTFFYMPEVKDEDTGEMVPNEVVPILQVGKDNPIKLLDGAQLKSPAELSRKLSQNGWFETTKKYYVIAADSGHVDMSDPDSLVVAMIIQDGKDAYATFMRGLAKKYTDNTLSTQSYNREEQIIEGLRHQFDLPQYKGGSEQAVKNRIDAQKEGRRRAFLNHNPEVINPTEEQVNNWYSKAPQDQRDDANDEVRRIMSGNNPIHTERHIRKQIQKLREARNQIINTCVQKGSDGNYIILTEGYKVVEPAEARISNGKINTQEKDGKHTFRSLTEGGFGMATDAQELTQQLNEDEVEIGVGLGKYKAPEGEEETVVHIDENRQGSWDPHIAKGKAGKIYIITQSPSGNKSAIQLREARLDNGNPDIQPDQVVEVIDENGNIKEGETPTVAEFIFRILTHTFNAKQFGMKTPDPRLLDELLEILVNNGKDTGNSELMKIQHYVKKLLWFDARNTLHIGLPDDEGTYKPTKLTKSQLFDPDFKDKYGHTSEENRKKVIAAIARNFHWNTERDVLSDNMVTSYPSLFGYLRTQFKNNESLKEFNFFGIDGLTFKKDEMFDENMKPKKFSHLAWMFTNNKLMTDVGDQVFKHPFVFGSGTKSVSPSEEARYQAAIAAREQKENKTLSQLGREILDKLGYKNRDRQDNGNIKGGLSGWKVRLVIKNPNTGVHYSQDEYNNNKDEYEKQSALILNWLKKYFGLNDSNTEILKPNRGGQGHYVRNVNGEKTEPFKHLSGGEIGESDFTVYIGSKEDVLKFVKDVENSEISELLSFGENNTDIKFSNLIHGRVEGRSIGFSGYTLPDGLQKILPNETIVYSDNNVEIFILDGKYTIRDLKNNKLYEWSPLIKDGVNGYVNKNIKTIRQKIAEDVYGEYISGSKEINDGFIDLQTIIKNNIENESRVKNIVKRISDYDGRQTGFTPAEFGQHLEEMIATPAEEARRILDEAGDVGFEDAALLDVPVWYDTSGSHIPDEELKEEVEKAVERYVAHYNKTHDKKIKPSDFNLKTLDRGNVTPIYRSEVIPMIGVKKDGKCIFSFADSMYIMNLGKKKNFATITGVYSSGKGGSGRINSTTARSWIKEAFGLTDDQIIITNAILKSTEDNKVFGVTQISADLINDEARVQFTLSKNAGHGIQFHEAFHYVNLLLHNKDKRQQIYDNYRKNHILRRNWSNERIEEALAEQFRRYAQMRTDRGILPSLKRMFNNFLDFAFQYRKRTLMRQIYDDILRGGYKGHILDKESVAEFKKAYPYGATSMNANIPNLRRDIAENFKAINTYSKFYQCAESLANAYIHFVLSQTVEDTIKAGSGSFESFLDDLRDRTEFGRSPYVQDILDNPIAFKYSILGVLKKYGIKGKTKSLKKYQEQLTQEKLGESLEQREGEDRYENTWDIDHFELSVKDNVAFRAKLFLSQIPNIKKDENTGQYVPVEDELLGTQSFIPYDEMYNLVMDELSSYSTFEDIRNRVRELAKTSDQFYSLNNVLDRIEGDIELENQLANTIKKQTPKLSFLQSDRPKPKSERKFGDDDTIQEGDDSMDEAETKSVAGAEILDQDKQLEIKNDNTLRPLRSTLRSWSQFAYSSNMFRYSEKEKANVVSAKTAYDLQDMLQDVSKLVKKNPSKLTEEQADAIVKEVFPMLLKLINKMAIPFDEQALRMYIDSHIGSMDYGNPIEQYKVLQDILGPAAKRGGNLKFFINLLVKTAESENTQFKHAIFKTPRAFYTIYNQFAADTEIGRMAKAYNAVHPGSSEHSVTVPGGKTMYPTNENNTASDIIRWINDNFEGRVDKMLTMPYSTNSIILNAAKHIQEDNMQDDLEFKLNLFVGMKDTVEDKGEDYFGITPLEDTVSKMMMIHSNMFVLPTMADKKTYYAIELLSKSNNADRAKRYFEMPHDILTYKKDSEDGLVVHQRFSKNTLDRFVGYFADEIKSLEQYYKRENIEDIVKDPNKLKENFHGNVSGGRMDFSGNGGLFRYFYDLQVKQDEDGNLFNLNQLLEFAYKRQQIAEDPDSQEGVSWIREDDKELDGFELVRRKLSEIKELYFDKSGDATEQLYDDINNMLFARVGEALAEYANQKNNQLLQVVESHGVKNIIPKAIPRQLLDEYQEMFKKAGIKNYTRDPYKVDDFGDSSDLALSVIGNYVAGQIISVIEVEKILSGDPAFFKYKYTNKPQSVTIDGVKIDTRVLKEKDTDKIKRLGSVLSPGSEIRTDYSKEILAKYPELTSKYYTVANISDVSARSIYIDELKTSFGKQILADYVRNNPNEKWVKDYLEHNKIGINDFINNIYNNDDIYNNLLKSIPESLAKTIDRQVSQSISPYEKITVADAEVMIRPALYRKIRIGLGQWSFTKHPIKYRDVDGTWRTVMYSDEDAFKILEEDGTWMSDPEKAAMVSQFEGFPLKMTYFSNDPGQLGQTNPLTVPVYNKMAIFPVFKYMFRSTTGQQIYNRMNMDENEIDMLTFESAVKVGLDKKKYTPYDKKTTSLATLKEGLNKKSSKYISKKDWSNKTRTDEEGTIAVEIQNLDNLRMQLNTESHSDSERALGTQMFKIMFSNIYDDEQYGIGTDHEKSGSDIRKDIMDCINALTIRGVHRIKEQFYMPDGDKVNENKVRQYIQRILENNGVGATAEEIIAKGNKVASLTTRKLIEQSVSALVNGDVIDINTNGGSAIQQSVFGFVSFDSNTIRTQQPEEEGYSVLNDGRELIWNEENGSMEVMLSMNFFKPVVPKKYQTSYNMMKWWLVENDIIKGIKTDGTESKPKPFGVGYRIPTQGLSSTFAFTVADVIPSQSGDVIVVPREFTAQTGSDFDVDKLFIATKSYRKGKLEQTDLSGDELVNATDGAIRNKMLENYINIVTDPKSFSNARASIDTITDVIKEEVLGVIRKSKGGYPSSMYELTPQFQSRRKQEFSVGKQGIGPFALNITNLALTQYAHLTMDFGEDNMTSGFHFNDLDKVTCEDEEGNITRISDWLSAMVNAHVDVAKDPYVFDLNVNKATYNHVNFLLRAGKGKATFLFIAQPALKEYASEVTSSGGMYGSHVQKDQKKKSANQILNEKISEYQKALEKAFNETVFRSEEQKLKWSQLIKKLKAGDVEWYKVFDTKAAQNALTSPNSLQGLFFQVFALKAFQKIDPYAQALSNLVRVSKVDTKKFGNDLTLHLNFINSYNKFRYGENEVKWTLTEWIQQNGEPIKTAEALDHYFSSTFLDTKLSSAIGMTRCILENQTYPATSIYSELFNTIMAELFGIEQYEINGYRVNGYKETLKEDIVTSIGTAIENIIRTKMLFRYGSQFVLDNPENLTWDEREKKNNYTGMIDFTFGNNNAEAVRQIRRLFLGDKKAEDQYHRNSLFDNIAALMEKMKKDPSNEKYVGLVDNEGRIINELLNYLRPTPATDEHPIPRMLFAKSKINTNVDEKSKLSSSFDFLLNHPNVGIRMLARDIALYAYYSTYDTNSISSFFDLVPYEFRWQYDSSLLEGLNHQDTQEVDLKADDVIDIMCRNFYLDDNIVPRYNTTPNKKEVTYADRGVGEYLGGMTSDMVNHTRIPSVIITTKAQSAYIKIQEKGITYLYKKIKQYDVKNDKTNKSESTWYGYQLIQKLGRHAGTTHQYEFLSDSTTPSMFEENEMPLGYEVDTAIEAFEQFKTMSDKRIKSGKHLEVNELKEIIYMGNTYKVDTHVNVDQNILKPDTQIIVTDKKPSEFSSVDIDLTKSIELIVSNLSVADGKINEVSISFSGTPDIKVKRAKINEYIDEQISIYSGRLDNSMVPQLREEAIAQFKEKVESVAEDNVRQRMLEDHIMNLLSELEVQGVVVDSAYLSFDNPVQKAAYKVISDNEIVDTDKLFIVSPEEIKTNQVEDVLHDEQLVLSNQEELEAQAVEKFVDDSINAQAEIAEEAAAIREEGEEAISDAVEDSDGLIGVVDDPNILAAFAQLDGISIASENNDENNPNKKNTDCK